MSDIYTPAKERSLFLRLYWPALIEQGLTIFIGFVSTIMVSNVGAYAVSGVSLVDQINFLVFNVFNALASGATVVIAQYIGASKAARAGETARQAVSICTLSAALLGVITITFGKSLLSLLYGSADPDVLDAGYIYLIFSGISYPFLGLYSASAGIMRAAGNTRTPMISSALSNIVNLAVASILIFGAGIGVYGVSIAMLLARITSGIMSYVVLLKSNGPVPFSGAAKRFEWYVLAPIFKVGVPTGIDSIIFQGSRIFLSTLLSEMGTLALHANAIGNSIFGLLTLSGTAFQIVTVTIVGQAYGAGQFLSAKKHMLKLCLYSSAFQILNYVPILPLLDIIVKFYGPAQETIGLVKQIIYSSCIMVPIAWSFSFILPLALRSVGDAKWTMYISLMSLLIFRVTGSWLLVKRFDWGVLGIWSGMYLDWIGRSAGYLIRAVFNFWNGRKKPVDTLPYAENKENLAVH